jgi:hypothetical protein
MQSFTVLSAAEQVAKHLRSLTANRANFSSSFAGGFGATSELPLGK